MINHYAILGIGFSASPGDVKSAYRKQARAVHPDAGHTGARDFERVHAAYEVLRDPKRRAVYDQALCAWLRSIGQLLCNGCGVANRIPEIPAGFHARCGHCHATLPITEPQRKAAVRVALAEQVAGLVEEVGGEMLSMARDAAVLGFERLRAQIGISKRIRRS